jgi:hypothetical protein
LNLEISKKPNDDALATSRLVDSSDVSPVGPGKKGFVQVLGGPNNTPHRASPTAKKSLPSAHDI